MRKLIIAFTMTLCLVSALAFSTVSASAHSARSTSPSITNAVWTCATYTHASSFQYLGGPAFSGFGAGGACTTYIETFDFTESALYCQPVLWTCLWFNQGSLGSGCTYNSPNGALMYYCPSNGTYNSVGKFNPQKGQLWAVQTHFCAYTPTQGSSCSDTQFNLQF